ncbi:hypothetical protein, unlikely [Trypanosoma brucei gambiense DAL972]|uniref:Uncharacterized protein n=1 Tax=Trypanosoma brucei gambiense (strain MHOM/CI/86/DAL972) TaxID=679716 RepID=C9ZU04_TRYB9|nr:hypothetical protein, unlikely [Trypanosoma brucei gambiense DAL972]CBH12890.1 hypothetical protein, unlikely [Trypanosoma brucei gambiense DAL972]|eukprot:XP_011775169.1 hypothetical protein, unlikely [Trypanosoma brucei gambiense DAL972]
MEKKNECGKKKETNNMKSGTYRHKYEHKHSPTTAFPFHFFFSDVLLSAYSMSLATSLFCCFSSFLFLFLFLFLLILIMISTTFPSPSYTLPLRLCSAHGVRTHNKKKK